jgi:hypothetical protein
MTTNYGQSATQDRMDPMLEALFKEMTQTGTYPKAASRAEDAAVAQALMVTLARTVSQASPYERALIVATLAPALAEALAPALVSALNNMAASNKTGQESGSGDGSDRQEGQ